jgi:DNA-binding CsgD family transcriptional regulator
MFKKFLFGIFLLVGTATVFSQKTLDVLLKTLDQDVAKEDFYTKKKQHAIHAVLQQLNSTNSNEKNYKIYHTLSRSYEVFIADSAEYYTKKSLETAQLLNNQSYSAESKIQLARIKAKAGMFPVSLDILKTIDKKILSQNQLIDYYKAYIEVYIYWIEYQDGHDMEEIIQKKNAVQDTLLAILPKNSYEYVINFGTKNIELSNYNLAEKELLQGFQYVKPDTREFSILNSILAYLYEKKNNVEKQKEYLAKSALSDIHAAVKENISLRSLSILLFDDNDISRANFYIKRSLEDANFYNARLRNIQIARVLPIIDKAYQIDRENQQKKLRILFITASILSLVLFIAVILIIKQNKKVLKAQKKLTETNEKLNILNDELKEASLRQIETNHSLAEANHLKEQYIKSFLEICTEYIDRLAHFKGIVNRKIKTGQTAEILKMTTSSQDNTKELKELYSNFDRAFLKIYPNFVEQINELLRPEERYLINDSQTLNQELRVFALIKLGVTNNNQIATFLHYTLRTIYNYRSKVKSKAIHSDESFEIKVQNLGNFSEQV